MMKKLKFTQKGAMATELAPPIVAAVLYVDIALFALALAGVFRAKIKLWWRGTVSVAVGQSNAPPRESECQVPPAKPAAPENRDRIADIMIKLDRIEAKIDRFSNRLA